MSVSKKVARNLLEQEPGRVDCHAEVGENPSSISSGDVAQTKQTNKNPGALGGATGAGTFNEVVKPQELNATLETVSLATFFWCKASGSVERFNGYPSGVAI